MAENYPLGGENPPYEPTKTLLIPVTVSITVSKQFIIEVNDYDINDEGEVDTSSCNLKKAIAEQVFTPLDIINKKGKSDSKLDKDLNGWSIDDYEVIED